MTDIDPIYQEIILDLYRHPRNKGVVIDAEADLEDANTSCGDVIRLTVKFENDVVHEIAHDSHGCAISQAAVSLLTDYVKNKNKDEVAKMTVQDMTKLLNIPISHTRLACATLGLKILQKMI